MRDIVAFYPYSDLSKEHRQLILHNSSCSSLSRDEVLFVEGERSNSVYVMLHGEIRLVKYAPDGHELPLVSLGPGETFAVATAEGNRRFPVTAIASRVSEVAALSHEIFKILINDPLYRDYIFSTLTRRMGFVTDQIVMLASCSIEERFFSYVKQRYGISEIYYLSETKKEIARNIETVPETLSRMIKRLHDQGIITWNNTELYISWEKLEQKK